MAASPKEKFEAAIKVIHSLPKDGPFQPSNEMMLTFYGFFKQATEGKCMAGKPNFWEVVKKAKWDAWHKLGDMEKETAMENYVEELKKTLKMCTEKWDEMSKNGDPRIVEAMPQTNVVGDFMDKLGSFYEIVDEESPIKGAKVPNNKPPGNSTGVTPDQSQSDTSTEQDKDDILDISQRVESALQTYSHEDEDEDEDDAVPITSQSPSLSLTNGDSSDNQNRTRSRSESESHSLRSSDSEEEFCDTSDNPLESQVTDKILKVPELEVQSSTPLKSSVKSHSVRFADSTSSSLQNGRVSPILDKTEYIHMPTGFPFITSKVNGQMSDSLLVQVPDTSVNRTVNSDGEESHTSFSSTDFSANNSSLYTELPRFLQAEGGEENEPPDGGEQNQGQDQGQHSGQSQNSGSARRGGSSRGNLSSSGAGRRTLLSGGGAEGGGEGNPPQGPPPQHQSMNEQITLILVRLQQDMTNVLDRLNRLEKHSRQIQKETESRSGVQKRSFFSWWPFSGRTGRTAFFILVWPVIVHLVLTYLFRRRRNR